MVRMAANYEPLYKIGKTLPFSGPARCCLWASRPKWLPHETGLKTHTGTPRCHAVEELRDDSERVGTCSSRKNFSEMLASILVDFYFEMRCPVQGR